jgi:hypothetical protein
LAALTQHERNGKSTADWPNSVCFVEMLLAGELTD